jgi:hypothetical protein
MSRPSDSLFFKAAKESYEQNPDQSINGFELVVNTATFDAYLNDQTKTLLIGVRGTLDSQDVIADASLAVNALSSSSRYKQDRRVMDSIVLRYPPSQYTYYITGHSLGGAINNQLKRDYPFIKEAVEFNPAFQPKDFVSRQSGIKRYYTKTDFLYKLGGRFLPNVQTIEPARFTGLTALDGLTGHKLENFSRLFNRLDVNDRGTFGIGYGVLRR